MHNIFRFETPVTGHLWYKNYKHNCLHTPTSSFSACAWKQALTAGAFQWLAVPPWDHDGSKSPHLFIFWIRVFFSGWWVWILVDTAASLKGHCPQPQFDPLHHSRGSIMTPGTWPELFRCKTHRVAIQLGDSAAGSACIECLYTRVPKCQQSNCWGSFAVQVRAISGTSLYDTSCIAWIFLLCLMTRHFLKLPVVPHKAVPEVSKIGNYRRGELLWCMDGRAVSLSLSPLSLSHSLCVSISLSIINLSIFLFILLSINLVFSDLPLDYLSIRLSVYLSFFPAVCPFIYPPVYLFICRYYL